MGSANFSAILEQFKGIIIGTYVVEYTSPDKTALGSQNVTVVVDAPGCVVGSDSSSYIVPGSSAEAWFGKGNDLRVQDKYDEALMAYDRAIELEPLYAEAWNFKGVTFIGLGRYDEALQALDKAIELKPDYASAWADKGWVLNSEGKYNESIQALDKAIELEPLYAEAWNGKSVDLISLERYEDALQASEKAIELGAKLCIRLGR